MDCWPTGHQPTKSLDNKHLETRFTLPFNLVAWTLWSLLLELGPGREEVTKIIINTGHKIPWQVEGHKPHFPHPAPVEEEGSSSEAQIDFLKMLLGSLYGLGQVAVVSSILGQIQTL